jgi:hypothetical protein
MRTSSVVAGVLSLVALCMLALPACSAPSLLGPTGLLLTPTADALGQSEYNLGFFVLDTDNANDNNVWVGNVGVSNGVEVGAARVKRDGNRDTILNAKYGIRPETEGSPGLAVGVIDATDEIESTVYFVASASLTRMLKTHHKEITTPTVHIGVGGGGLDGFFGGASVVLGDVLTLMAEYDTNDVNLGARLAVGPELRVHAGFINELNDFALGVSFNKMY